MLEKCDKKGCNMGIGTVGIIGLGALGTMYGHHLSEKLGKKNVFMIADEERIKRYRKQGIYCNNVRCDFSYLQTGTRCDCLDLIIFTVKFNYLEQAIEAVKPYVGENTILLSMLNGISSEELIKEKLAKGHVLYCTVQGMDAVKERNQTTYTQVGYITYGEKKNRNSHSDQVKRVAELFDQIQLKYQVPEDMYHQMWGKLILNVGVNQAVAVFETNYGGIQQQGKAREVMIGAMKEAAAIAEAEGVFVSQDELEDWIKLLDTLGPLGKPSLRQDTEAQRQTEVELFGGTILKLGRKHQIETPYNDYLYRRIKEIESLYPGK